jgi:hypothetical protein
MAAGILPVTLFVIRVPLPRRGGVLMRMLETWKFMAALALAAVAVPASAGTVYRWTAEDGSVSFADDAKRIPARYRDAAEKIEASGLTGYKRYSPTNGASQITYLEQLHERVARLRELNEALDRVEVPQYTGGGYAGAQVAPPSGPSAMIEAGDGLTVSVPNASAGEGPVVVQDVRVRRPGSAFTSTDTVITQDGRVLLVLRGDRHWANPSSDAWEEGDFIPDSDIISE